MSKKLILAASLLLASCSPGEQPNVPAPGNGSSTVVEDNNNTPDNPNTDQSNTDVNANIKTLFVDSELATCTGVGLQTCMRVRSDNTQDWQFFYNQIEGFNYEPGFIYELKVSESKVNNPPADASSIKTTLVEVVKKEAVATASVENTKWVYANALKDSEITLNFAEGKVSGSSGCNLFMGEYTQTGNVLNIKALGSTRKACADSELQTQEQDFMSQLGKVNSVSQTDGLLVLSGEQDTKLTFKAAPVESISNTQWEYKYTEINGTVLSPVLAETALTLNFSDTQATGSAGCNSFMSEYASTGETLSFKNIASTRKLCLTDSIMEQENDYLKRLGRVKGMHIEGKMLTLNYDQNAKLVFEASSL